MCPPPVTLTTKLPPAEVSLLAAAADGKSPHPPSLRIACLAVRMPTGSLARGCSTACMSSVSEFGAVWRRCGGVAVWRCSGVAVAGTSAGLLSRYSQAPGTDLACSQPGAENTNARPSRSAFAAFDTEGAGFVSDCQPPGALLLVRQAQRSASHPQRVQHAGTANCMLAGHSLARRS